MAEFCNSCAEKMQQTSDFDVYAIHKKLKPDHYQGVLCEGCGMVAILKEDDGELKVGYPNGEFIAWRTYLSSKDLV